MPLANDHPQSRGSVARSLVLVLLLVLMPKDAWSQEAADSKEAASSQMAAGSVVFRDVRVFDGHRVHERATVLVRDGRIVSVAPDAEVPADALVIAGGGRTLLPGLIDAHSHEAASPVALELAIMFGVTTTLDMFSMPQPVARMRTEQLETGAPHRADVYSAGALVTAPGGHGTQFGPWLPTIQNAEEAESFVDGRVAEGSDYIKIVYDAYGADAEYEGPKTFVRGFFPSIDRTTLAAVVDAAQAHGKLAVVHALNVRSAHHALEAGADGLVHLYSDSLPGPDFVRAAVEGGMFVVPTLAVLGSYNGATDAAELMADSTITSYLPPDHEARWRLTGIWGASVPDKQAWRDRVTAAVRQLDLGGVRILAGTDAGNPGTVFGATLHHELALLVEAGLTPAEALTAATAAPAQAFGLDDRGRIAPGLRADLLLVDGDPTTDVRATRKIVGVWKLGVEVDREAYRERQAPARATFASFSRPGVSRISDFEDSDVSASVGNWARFGNRAWGGSSTAAWSVVADGADGTGHSLSIEGTIVANETFSASGALYWPLGPVDLTAKSEIAFWAKGDGRSYRLIAFGQNVAQSFASQTFVAGPEWTEIGIPLRGFEGVDPAAAVSFLFAGPEEPGEFVLQVDEIRFR